MKLHLGCGNRYIPGFFHIDGFDAPHIDHVCSIENLSFIESNSIELIYSSHVLEHFKRARLPDVLKEWNRILKPGGILRIAVPDFEGIVRVYQKYQDLNLIIGPLYGGQNYLYNIHYNVFDFITLKDYLISSGFDDIKRFDWRKTEHSHIDDFSQAYIPHMDKENGILISLNVESTKIIS
jgi:predicted SAM-dependent methyltransferase